MGGHYDRSWALRPSFARHARMPSRAIHRRQSASEDHAFLQAVAQSIAAAGAVLITGPANAKTELVKHISQHDPRLMKIIVGVETVDQFRRLNRREATG
jgi:stalled ribosome rescue protein Dom34